MGEVVPCGHGHGTEDGTWVGGRFRSVARLAGARVGASHDVPWHRKCFFFGAD